MTSPKQKPRNPASTTPLSDDREFILLAVTGSAVAVLTETVWALAHERPPVIPRRVVVVTPGRQLQNAPLHWKLALTAPTPS